MGYRLRINADQRTFLENKVHDVIERALHDRSGLEQEWALNDEQYDGKIVPSDHPWPGSNSFFVPLGETYTNAITGRLTDAIHAPEPTFMVKNRRRSPEWKETADATQDLIEYVVDEVLDLRDKVSEPFTFTLAKHGTAFCFMPWQMLLQKRMGYNIDADLVTNEVGVHQVGATAVVPPIHDILMPKEAQTAMTAPWIAYRIRLYDDDLDVREFSKVYDAAALKLVRNYQERVMDERTRRNMNMAGFSTGDSEDFYEIWNWYGLIKLPGWTSAAEIIVPYHMGTKTSLTGNNVVVNFYPHQFRPFFHANFQRAESGPYGRGVLRMTRSGNVEINALHKHRVDNAMVANTRMMKVKMSSYTQLPRNFKIWPGRLVPVLDMADFEAVAMADVYGSTLEAEMLTTQTMQRLVGLSDFSLTGGSGENLKRVGATPALVAVQESGRVLNYRLNHLRTAYGMMAAWIIEMYAHFRPIDEIQTVLGPAGTKAIMRLLDAPADAVRGKLLIELSASSATINREIDKQSDVMLVNMLSQYGEKHLMLVDRLMAIMTNPQIPDQFKQPLVMDTLEVVGMSNSAMKDILKDFNKRNDALLLTRLTDAIQSSSIGQSQGQPALEGGPGQGAGPMGGGVASSPALGAGAP